MDKGYEKIYQGLNWWKTSQVNPPFRVEWRPFGEFKAFLGDIQIGQAYLSNHRPGEFVLDAIDIEEAYQRKGYGTLLMREIAKYLRSVGAKILRSSNEGSGTVQMLDKVFGRDKIRHRHGDGTVNFEEAKEIMDVNFGYTSSEVYLQGQPPPEEEE